jgi:hypothetical protein
VKRAKNNEAGRRGKPGMGKKATLWAVAVEIHVTEAKKK